MISLEISEGILQIGNQKFSPSIGRSEMKKGLLAPQIEPYVLNDPWESYKLTVSQHYTIILFFYYENLKSIQVYPKNKAGYVGEDELNRTLIQLGGEYNYSWGKVELSIDVKSGNNSIIISYT